MTPLELYTEGKLCASIDAAVEVVRQRPRDLGARLLLGELMVIAGDLPRAEGHFATVVDLADSEGRVISEGHAELSTSARACAGLLKAAHAREAYYSGYGLPSLSDESPSQVSRLLINAAVELRQGAVERARELVDEAQQRSGAVAGEADGVTFQSFRDLDDLSAWCFEFLSVEGEYLWIPIASVSQLEFFPPRSPIARHWRPVRVMSKGVGSRMLAMPSTYGLLDGADEADRVGLRTRWVGAAPSPIRGIGQRVFLADGHREIDIMDLTKLMLRG